MSIIDTILSFLAPYDCLRCGWEGALLCKECCVSLPALSARCYRCKRPWPESYTCDSCRTVTPLARVGAAVSYQGPAKDLLWRLKSGGAQSATQVMARCMAPLLRSAPPNAVLVPVPTATSRVRQRGYDQAILLARALSHETGIPLRRYLKRVGQTHQVGSGREQRLRQLTRAFELRKEIHAHEQTIILVDDVLTTGATLERAAQALHSAGVLRIQAVTFAQPVYEILKRQH